MRPVNLDLSEAAQAQVDALQDLANNLADLLESELEMDEGTFVRISISLWPAPRVWFYVDDSSSLDL